MKKFAGSQFRKKYCYVDLFAQSIVSMQSNGCNRMDAIDVNVMLMKRIRIEFKMVILIALLLAIVAFVFQHSTNYSIPKVNKAVSENDCYNRMLRIQAFYDNITLNFKSTPEIAKETISNVFDLASDSYFFYNDLIVCPLHGSPSREDLEIFKRREYRK